MLSSCPFGIPAVVDVPEVRPILVVLHFVSEAPRESINAIERPMSAVRWRVLFDGAVINEDLVDTRLILAADRLGIIDVWFRAKFRHGLQIIIKPVRAASLAARVIGGVTRKKDLDVRFFNGITVDQ